MKVFIDDRQVGLLRDRHAHAFAVPAGAHRVAVKRDCWRSLPLDVAVAPGTQSELECGFSIGRSLVRLELLKLLFLLVLAATLAVIVATDLPFWSLGVVLGAEAVAFGVIWWRLFVPPKCLFVPPLGAAGGIRSGSAGRTALMTSQL